MSDEPLTQPTTDAPQYSPRVSLTPDQWQIVRQMAEQLGEPKTHLLAALIYHAGLDFALALLDETLSVEAQGGLLVKTGSRRRTPGGVFFFLAKQKLSWELRRLIFPPPHWKRKRAVKRKPPNPGQAFARQQAALPRFDWAQRRAVLLPLLDDPGPAHSVKVVLTGRPATYELFSDLALITLSRALQINVPRGVPRPEIGEITYPVLIALKQWRKVEAALLADETDLLVIEGLYAYNDVIGGMAIYATNATSRNLQRQQREKQQN